jgi:hypothetical protein
MKILALCLCVALLGTTPAQARRDRIFCAKSPVEIVAIADVVRPSDNGTQAIQSDAHALRMFLESSRAGRSGSANDKARWQRVRTFVKKKCHGRDIGPNLP